MANKTKRLGNHGEKLAEDLLIKRGYKILERNFYIRGGEIDIVAKKDGEIVFVEVKTRTNKHFGEILEQINQNKQNKLIRAAECFLEEYEYQESPWRIDVITIYAKEKQKPKIEHLKNAITLF